MIPDNRKYSATHEWFLVSGDTVTIGITQHAADELTDITFVELPKLGAKLKEGDAFGEIESVKATSELFTAVGGEVVAVNKDLTDHPEHINDDPFERGWIVKIKAASTTPLDALMDAKAYEAKINS